MIRQIAFLCVAQVVLVFIIPFVHIFMGYESKAIFAYPIFGALIIVSQIFVLLGIWRGSAESARFMTIMTFLILVGLLSVSKLVIVILFFIGIQLFIVFKPTFRDCLTNRINSSS